MAMIDRPNATMEAAVFHGHERITIERVKIPDVGAGEVLVRVSRTALCGSDFKLWHKGAEFTAGHEIFGVVEQPGHPMHGWRCAVYIPLHCDRCDACRRGDTQMCLEISSLIGWNRPGGYAEYLPVPENCLLPVPDDIEDSLAPLLLDTIGTSAHAVRFVSRVVPPQEAGPVLVTGAGPVGLGVILALQDAGYPRHPRFRSQCGAPEDAQSFGAQSPSGRRYQQALCVDHGMLRRACRAQSRHRAGAAARRAGAGRRERRALDHRGRQGVSPQGFLHDPHLLFPDRRLRYRTSHLLRRYKDEYRVLVDGEFGLQRVAAKFRAVCRG